MLCRRLLGTSEWSTLHPKDRPTHWGLTRMWWLIFRDRGEERVDVRGIGELVGTHPNLSEVVLERLAERGEIRCAGMGWKDNFGSLTITERGRSRLKSEQPTLPPTSTASSFQRTPTVGPDQIAYCRLHWCRIERVPSSWFTVVTTVGSRK